MSDRVGPITATVTDEALWVVSRSPGGWSLSQTLGDESGRYGRDHVALAEYGEVLLLDPTTLEILRAWPLPGMPPNGLNGNDHLLVTDDAVYLSHQGDGALPDSHAMRIDRATFDAVVRVKPVESAGLVVDGELPLPYWTLDPEAAVGRLLDHEAGLVVIAFDEVHLVDPRTSQTRREITVGHNGTLLPGTAGMILDTGATDAPRLVDALTLEPTEVPPLPTSQLVLHVATSRGSVAVRFAPTEVETVIARWSVGDDRWTVTPSLDGATAAFSSDAVLHQLLPWQAVRGGDGRTLVVTVHALGGPLEGEVIGRFDVTREADLPYEVLAGGRNGQLLIVGSQGVRRPG